MVPSGRLSRSRGTSTGFSPRRVRLRGFKLLQGFHALGTYDGDPDKYGPFDRACAEQLEGLLDGAQTVGVPQAQEDPGARHRERGRVDAISGGRRRGSPGHVGTTPGRRHDQLACPRAAAPSSNRRADVREDAYPDMRARGFLG